MNEDKQPTNNAAEPQVLRHEKVIAPPSPNLKPEEPIARSVQPDMSKSVPVGQTTQLATQVQTPTNLSISPSNPQQTISAEPFNAGRYWAGKVLKLLIAGMVGGLVAVSYYYYLTNGNILDRALAASRHYSPLVLEDTIITTIVLIVAYGLLLRFILRSKYSFGQAIFAMFSSQLIVLALLAMENMNNNTVGIFGDGSKTYLAIAASAGVLIFVATNSLAERVWTWKISRSMLAVLTMTILLIATFSLSKIAVDNYAKQQAEQKAVSEKVKKDSAAGLYNFDGGYQQYFPNASMQQRFTIVRISSESLVKNKDTKDYPHSTGISFRDKNYTGTNDALTIEMVQSRASSNHNPPTNCGHPMPHMNQIDQKAGLGTYKGQCYKVQDMPGMGVLYGRNEYAPHNEPEEQAVGTYDWYYLKYGDTLITLDSVGTLTGQDVVALFSNLDPISPLDLLEKSKSMANEQ